MATSSSEPNAGKLQIVNNVINFVNIYYRGIEVGHIDEAKDWIRDYYKQLLPQRLKEQVDSFEVKLYMLAKERVELPFMIDIVLDAAQLQRLYTLIIVEPRASLSISCRCMGAPGQNASHIRVSETYVADEGYYSSEAVTLWRKEVEVEDYYYYSLESHAYARVLQKNLFSAKHKLVEENFVLRGSYSRVELQVGNLVLSGKMLIRESAEILGSHNSVNLKTKLFVRRGEIDNYMLIRALGKHNRGYSDCDEYVVGKQAKLRTIPELYSADPSNELMHEARLGRIKRKEVEYLLARGLSPREVLYALLLS
jgi:Fe-S cluster assembly scaffold protein SufB